MYERLFDTLRTKEQLGYSVSCDYSVVEGVLGFYVIVQSSKYSVAHVHGRIAAFLSEFHGYVTALAADKYAAFVTSLVDKKLQPDDNFSQETARHWTEIRERRCVSC